MLREQQQRAVELLMERGLSPGSHHAESILRDHDIDPELFDADAALGAFSRDLLSEDPEVRLRAAAALAWMFDRRAVSPLLRALRDSEWDVRLTAAEGLAMLSPLPVWAFEPLCQRASDPEPAVRAALITTIARSELVDAVSPLVAGLCDVAADVVIAAAEGLQHLGRIGITSTHAASTLSKRLAKESNPHVAYALYWALGWQGGKTFELERSKWRYSIIGQLAWRVVAGAP